MVKAIPAVRYRHKPWLSIIGIPVTGLLWSLAIMWVNSEQLTIMGIQPTQAFLIVAFGGLAQTVALWAGFSAVIWAMVRAFGGRLPFSTLFALTSSASWPLWLGAPAAAYWLQPDQPAAGLATLILVLCLVVFLHNTARRLSNTLGWSGWRSLGTSSAAAIFLCSFTFLTH